MGHDWQEFVLIMFITMNIKMNTIVIVDDHFGVCLMFIFRNQNDRCDDLFCQFMMAISQNLMNILTNVFDVHYNEHYGTRDFD